MDTDFWDAVVRAFRIAPEADPECDRRIRDLPLDEIALFELITDLQRLNPHFTLPEQLDIGDATVEDIHHYFQVMGPGHEEA